MKKILMVVAGAGCAVFFSLVFLGYDESARIFQMFPALFVLSLLTSLLNDRAFRTWAWFAGIYIPISILLVLLAPEYGSPFLPIEKDTVGLGANILFVIISLLLAGSTYISRGGRRGE